MSPEASAAHLAPRAKSAQPLGLAPVQVTPGPATVEQVAPETPKAPAARSGLLRILIPQLSGGRATQQPPFD
jgi:hypothetical protein